MARLFDDAQSEYLQVEPAVLSGTPLAMVCWFNIDFLDEYQYIMWLGNKDVANHCHALLFRKIADELSAYSIAGGTSVRATATASISANTWHHGCAIFVSVTDRRVLLDGGNKGTDATSRSPTGLNRLSFGARRSSAPDLYLSGKIAEAAIWDLSKWPGATNSDKADNFERIIPSLAAGFTPDNYPLGLVAYWNLIRGLNDRIGGYNLTANGTVVAAHPRIISPAGVL